MVVDYLVRKNIYQRFDFNVFLLFSFRVRLEDEAEELSKMAEPNDERLMDIYERLDELDAATAQPKAARILFGLGMCRLKSS